jgi:hypothetical protein
VHRREFRLHLKAPLIQFDAFRKPVPELTNQPQAVEGFSMVRFLSQHLPIKILRLNQVPSFVVLPGLPKLFILGGHRFLEQECPSTEVGPEKPVQSGLFYGKSPQISANQAQSPPEPVVK